MSFPCLICGDLPVPVAQQGGSGSSGGGGSGGTGSGAASGQGIKRSSSGNGTTVRTLSKDVSDKIFQNLCRHLAIKTEPYWFIQNPGEQMPLCAICAAAVLDIYTLQSKIDQCQALIRKHVWKLERMVADTEIAYNWMATREENEEEEHMWNSFTCTPVATRIARERHHKFRLQILQNFKSKVKIRQKLRAAGQPTDDIDLQADYATLSGADSVYDLNNGASSEATGNENNSQPFSKRSRIDTSPHIFLGRGHGIFGGGPSKQSSGAVPSPGSGNSTLRSNLQQSTPSSSLPDRQSSSTSLRIPQTISLSTTRTQSQEFVDESECSDSDNNSQVYPDVQIICPPGQIDILKEENDQDYSNSGDGDESGLEQDVALWNLVDDNVEGDEPMCISEGEEALWLSPDVALRKSFVDKLLHENLKPSVFLRKLAFALFGLKQLANSSGICGSSKPGSKPSVDRYKFEALREYTIDTYGIREDYNELEDLNRKIRTICCDARKALKRRMQKPAGQSTLHTAPNAAPMSLELATTSAIASSFLNDTNDERRGEENDESEHALLDANGSH